MTAGSEVPFYTVETFTDTPFRGNPAANGLLGGGSLDAETMQALAAEMDLSETASLHASHDRSSSSTPMALTFDLPPRVRRPAYPAPSRVHRAGGGLSRRSGDPRHVEREGRVHPLRRAVAPARGRS